MRKEENRRETEKEEINGNHQSINEGVSVDSFSNRVLQCEVWYRVAQTQDVVQASDAWSQHMDLIFGRLFQKSALPLPVLCEL